MTPDEIRRRVAEYEWYHTIDLGQGVATPGQYDLEPLLPHYGIPGTLAGKSVLDVGPAHGYFAFEFERRGATVATAELPNWAEHDASPVLQHEFARAGDSPESYHRGALGFAIEARGSQVRRHFCNVYDLTPERVGTYDTTLHVMGQSRALFVGQPNGQAFWLPTITCLEQMVLAAGFARVERVSTFHLKSTDGRFDTPHGTVRAFVA
jgi:hypothetical protein